MRHKIFSLFVLILTLGSISSCSLKSSHNTEESIFDKYQLELINDKRIFKSNVKPKNEAEIAILDNFKVRISDEYTKFNDIYVETDSFKNMSEGYENNLKNGMYTKSIIIDKINELNEEAYSSDTNDIRYYFNADKLNNLAPYQYKIIEVHYTATVSDEALNVATFGNGSWIRYFVVVKELQNSPWKIFDVYGSGVYF